MIISAGLLKKIRAILGSQPGRPRLYLPARLIVATMKIQSPFHAGNGSSVRWAIHLVLFDSHRLANQNNLATIRALPQADIFLRVIRPALQIAPQIHDIHSQVFLSNMEN